MRIDCPWPEFEDSYIVLPDQWLGAHSARYDEALEKARELPSEVLRKFAIALVLLDDWRLPGIEGNPDNWDFEQMRLELLAWVGTTVWVSYWQCFTVPKVSSPASQTG